MENKELINDISESAIKEKIYTIRGIQVMLDSDLAEIYGYKTKNFNRQVKNNIEKFPEDMMFKLTKEDILYLSRCKNFTLNKQNGRGYNIKYYPYVFTEQGIYMLMTVLKGELATKQSLALVRVFKQMKDYLIDNAVVFRRLDKIEFKQLETDEKFRQIFKQLEEPREKKAALFFQGQLFDAFSCLADIISKAKGSIVLIDNYVNTGTLDLLSKKESGVSVDLITSKKGCKLTTKEISDFNSQYGNLEVKFSEEFHDRFMILDSKVLYHIGASLKDAGKKAFEVSIIDDEKQLQEILKRI